MPLKEAPRVFSVVENCLFGASGTVSHQGCGEDMASSGLLPQIVLGPVASGIADEDPRVRHAALSCLSQMSEDFGEWNGGVDDEESQNEGSFQGTFHEQVIIMGG